ncbi:mechanosensitive ion channel domain-containing protein [Sphingobacterium tabacisoli]|uniref:Mechanosensitive ion channel domain-containing protein n=1 Tax=Sphingobacterium tabacisoli TaxID=2044855 RepID=A0ABW5L5G1_9SPHI|nr:mechanosensitive ion channel domain-containing protein [Sphingobacterium tabacisoli]
MKRKLVLRCYVLLVFYMCVLSLRGAQIQRDSTIHDTDSSQSDFVSRMEVFFNESAQRSLRDLENDKAAIRQNQVMEEIKALSRQARSFLKKGFDTLELKTDLQQVIQWHYIVKEGVFENKGSYQTSRNLTTTSHILKALYTETSTYKRKIDSYQDRLSTYRLQIDSLSNERALFIFPRDSAELQQYVHKLKVLALEIAPITQQIHKSMNDIQLLQNDVNLELLNLETGLEEVLYYQQQLAGRSLSQEFPKLWEPNAFDRPFKEILSFSLVKAKLVFSYYLRGYWSRLFLLLIAISIVTVYIYSLRKDVKEEGKINISKSMILRRPLISGLLIGLSLGQFIFPSPPFLFSTIMLLSCAILMTLLLQGFTSPYWMAIWLSLLTLYIAIALDNMILQTSRPERWGLLFISLSGFLLGIYTLLHKSKHIELLEKWILYPIAIMAFMSFLSIFFNLFGRFNIAKVLTVSGVVNVIAAIIFLWVLRLVNEGLSYASSMYRKRERRLFYINYDRVGQRAPSFFYLVLILGWFVIVGRNFYEFKLLSEPIRDIFYARHTLGRFSFSLYTLLVFILIMLGATVLSKIVSFFASDTQSGSREGKDGRKFHLGSWILLIRIIIIVLGFLLAFAAVGIPLQQITLIIGALGLGIGFGLQTLVNNLVSGLIIAFEKPVNVDDLIDINGQSGRVKSIGFRSSVIAIPEGADLVIPNGDLLNSHVINWTMGGFKKRIHLPIAIRYGTDLDLTKAILTDLLSKHSEVLPVPAPWVLFGEVSAQSVHIELYFWVKTFKDTVQVKSAVIADIARLFDEQSILFAMPMQEIVLHKTTTEEK